MTLIRPLLALDDVRLQTLLPHKVVAPALLSTRATGAEAKLLVLASSWRRRTSKHALPRGSDQSAWPALRTGFARLRRHVGGH